MNKFVESEIVRADKDFKKRLKKIKLDRMTSGKDDMPRSYRRITKAIMRHEKFIDIENDIINADLDAEGVK